uniref:Uncharacterized protein n=1 Tax=Tanacetum cinerariifolium TaxID=118510 RepID=A0A699KKW3_TANCI|nr:hypothetical protein [Tanacetum cinerariifolium]
MCAELRTSCDREHNRVLELEAEISKLHNMLKESKKCCIFIQKDHIDLQVKFQNYKESLRNQKVCEQPNVTASNEIFEINKLKAQLQEKDDTIRHLHAEKDILEKIATQKAEIATLKTEAIGKKNSGPTGTPTKPKVLASAMYSKSSKTSPRSTQKPPVQHKKPTISVNMFPKAKPATEARKTIPKRNTQNHNPLPAKSVKARRAANYYRNLYVDISQFVDRSTKSVHAKPHQIKHVVNTSINAWNATKNIIERIVPIWKPTGRRFNLHDIFGSRTSTEPIVKPSKLTPCISPSTNATLSLEPILEPIELSLSVSSCASSTITMVSRFFDYRLSDRKAGSNGISSIFY